MALRLNVELASSESGGRIEVAGAASERVGRTTTNDNAASKERIVRIGTSGESAARMEGGLARTADAAVGEKGAEGSSARMIGGGPNRLEN
jgi:hypothetical protein